MNTLRSTVLAAPVPSLQLSQTTGQPTWLLYVEFSTNFRAGPLLKVLQWPHTTAMDHAWQDAYHDRKTPDVPKLLNSFQYLITWPSRSKSGQNIIYISNRGNLLIISIITISSKDKLHIISIKTFQTREPSDCKYYRHLKPEQTSYCKYQNIWNRDNLQIIGIMDNISNAAKPWFIVCLP